MVIIQNALGIVVHIGNSEKEAVAIAKQMKINGAETPLMIYKCEIRKVIS